MELKELIVLAVEKKASDLHITENEPPILRIDGILKRTGLSLLTREHTKRIIYSVLTSGQNGNLFYHIKNGS